MSDHLDEQRSEADAELEREIRRGRTFTLEEAAGAIGRSRRDDEGNRRSAADATRPRSRSRLG